MSQLVSLLNAHLQQCEGSWSTLMQSTIDPDTAAILQQLITTQRAILGALRGVRVDTTATHYTHTDATGATVLLGHKATADAQRAIDAATPIWKQACDRQHR